MKIDNKTNINSPVCCEEPSIIFNPRFYEYIIQYDNVMLNGEILNPRQFAHIDEDRLKTYVRRLYEISLDTYNNFGILRPDGSIIPLFYVVPCGKCQLCRDNKSNEYAFRAACETATYPYNPLFVTVTYKDKYLPKNGVEVEDLQLFIKRLRRHLVRAGLPSNFRYLAVGEYGSKFGRPHYHLELWNYPVDHCETINQAYGFIYKAWLAYKKDENGKRIYLMRKVKGKQLKRYPVMESKGMIKILPVKEGCPSYIVKYFRKDCSNKCGYPNKTFLVSSRRNGGIGSQYISSQLDSVIASQNSLDCSISVLDPYLNKTVTRKVGGYLKNFLFKSRSAILPKKQYDIVKSIVTSWYRLKAICYAHSKPHDFEDILPIFKRIKHTLRYYISDYPRHYYQCHFKDLFNTKFTCRKHEFTRIFNDLIGNYFKLDFNRLKTVNDKLKLREAFFDARKVVQDLVQVKYNIPGSLDKSSYNYNRYLQRCTF